MRHLRPVLAATLLALAGCKPSVEGNSFVGPWQEVRLEPGEVAEVALQPIAQDLRGELDLDGALDNTTWVVVADGRELAAGRLHAATTGLYGLHASGPLRLSVTTPTNAPTATLRYRLRLRPGFEGEEDEARASAPAGCGASGCTGVIGWPADIDTFLVSPQGGAGTEIRLTGVPGVAWDLRVTEGANLKAQAASLEGEGTSVVVPGGGKSFVVTVRSRTDSASPIPYRLRLRGLGGPLATP